MENQEIKDFIQRKKSQWQNLARDPRRIDIVLERCSSIL